MYMMSLHICNVYIHIYMHICAHTIYSVTVCLHMNRSYGYSILQQMFINSLMSFFADFSFREQRYSSILPSTRWMHTIIRLYSTIHSNTMNIQVNGMCVYSLRTYIYIFLHSNTMKVYEECMYVYTEIDRSFLSI